MATLSVKCPRCGKITPYRGNPDRPFCSEKCRLVDLGRWANEEYRVPGAATPGNQEPSEDTEG